MPWPNDDRMHGLWPIPDGANVDVPTSYAAFPNEIRRPPRSNAQRTDADIRQRTVRPKGGHFAAMEHPELLTGEPDAVARTVVGRIGRSP